MFERFVKAVDEADASIIEELRDKTNRQVKTRVIELIREKGTADMLPLIEAWASTEVKKLKAALNTAAREITIRNAES